MNWSKEKEFSHRLFTKSPVFYSLWLFSASEFSWEILGQKAKISRLNMCYFLLCSMNLSKSTVLFPVISIVTCRHMGIRAPDKMRICVFHSNLNVKNSIIFGNVRIMYAKHFPDTQLCPVSKRTCFVYILMEYGLLPIFPFIRAK